MRCLVFLFMVFVFFVNLIFMVSRALFPRVLVGDGPGFRSFSGGFGVFFPSRETPEILGKCPANARDVWRNHGGGLARTRRVFVSMMFEFVCCSMFCFLLMFQR